MSAECQKWMLLVFAFGLLENDSKTCSRCKRPFVEIDITASDSSDALSAIVGAGAADKSLSR
jgi:hypothetical protein